MELVALPKRFRERTIMLANEAAWQKEDARSVIEFLASQEHAVLGMELWVPEGDVPRVVGWSDYNVDFSGNWDTYVQSNAQCALRELEKVIAGNNLINLTWVGRDEVEDK